mgnify:CR=1 FL=1
MPGDRNSHFTVLLYSERLERSILVLGVFRTMARFLAGFVLVLVFTVNGLAAQPARAIFETNRQPVVNTPIDNLILEKLVAKNIQPAAICSDSVFVRRAFLDIAGILPTAADARAFLDDPDPDKRQRLIDALLERPESAAYWTLKWCDILRVKSEFPVNLWPNAAQAYHRHIYEAVRDNRPYDEFVRGLLTATGSNFRQPEVNIYRAVRDRTPRTLAQAMALTWMGVRTDRWPQDKQVALAVFFQDVRYKKTGEWK